MNASDYGGGTPIVDVWRRDVGIGVGHVEPTTAPDFVARFHAQRESGTSRRSVSL